MMIAIIHFKYFNDIHQSLLMKRHCVGGTSAGSMITMMTIITIVNVLHYLLK